jgi:hypothetical protein
MMLRWFRYNVYVTACKNLPASFQSLVAHHRRGKHGDVATISPLKRKNRSFVGSNRLVDTPLYRCIPIRFIQKDQV